MRAYKVHIDNLFPPEIKVLAQSREEAMLRVKELIKRVEAFATDDGVDIEPILEAD